jgi:hypothetical protein
MAAIDAEPPYRHVITRKKTAAKVKTRNVKLEKAGRRAWVIAGGVT